MLPNNNCKNNSPAIPKNDNTCDTVDTKGAESKKRKKRRSYIPPRYQQLIQVVKSSQSVTPGGTFLSCPDMTLLDLIIIIQVLPRHRTYLGMTNSETHPFSKQPLLLRVYCCCRATHLNLPFPFHLH